MSTVINQAAVQNGLWDCMGWSPALQAGNSAGFNSRKVQNAGVTQPGECFSYKEEVGSSILSIGIYGNEV